MRAVNVEIFGASKAEIMQQWSSVLPGGRFLCQDGVCAMVTGIPLSPFNGVWSEHAHPDAAAVAALLDEVSRARVPYGLKLPPGCEEAVTRLAAARGMAPVADIALMGLDAAGAVGAGLGRVPDGLTIQRLAPERAPRAAAVAAAGFGTAQDIFLRAMTPDLLRLASVRCYVGEVAGQPVTTSLSVTLGSCTGIFCVATVPGFRGRGFGAAVTARAVADGLAAGSAWCWLEASGMGLPVYQKLGFQIIEPRRGWASAS
ncbi:MAG TPA: GNAT family N-acetyltransferase [Trebonia sp.]|nr:GNAT family N-acetyltransferase [Trebonia sp.]